MKQGTVLAFSGIYAKTPPELSHLARSSGRPISEAGPWLYLQVHGFAPEGLNGRRGLIRSGPRRLEDRVNFLASLFRKGRARGRFEGPVTVCYARGFRASPMDSDNLSASFKCVGDALVRAEILEGDGPGVLELVALQDRRPKDIGACFSLFIRARDGGRWLGTSEDTRGQACPSLDTQARATRPEVGGQLETA